MYNMIHDRYAIKHKLTGQLLYQPVEGAWLRGADLTGVALSQAGLAHQDLTAARLCGVDLSGADLRFASLADADLEGVRLVGADLYKCDLSGANLRQADLSGVDLRCSRLSGADLTGASLRQAELRWATLAEACLNDTDLTAAVLDNAILHGVGYDSRTRWPALFAQLPPVAAVAPKAADQPPGFRRATTRRVGRAGTGTVRLWTVQTPDIWERLQREGELDSDPDWVCPEYRSAFDWMRNQMARRVPGYTGRYPWWAFAQPKPSLRQGGFPGRRGAGLLRVRLELAVPAEQVLLSNFDAWNAVLNHRLLSLSEAESDAWDAELEMSGYDRTQPLPESWETELQRTWERIFDLEALATSERYRDWITRVVNRVQATFERLERAQVVAVTEFMPRKGSW